MNREVLTNQLNIYEIEKNKLDERLNMLSRRLSIFNKKEERSAKLMKNFLTKASLLGVLSFSSFLLPGVIQMFFTVATFSLCVCYAFATAFQIHAHNVFKRFNIHSRNRFNKITQEITNITLSQQKILAEIEKLSNGIELIGDAQPKTTIDNLVNDDIFAV